MTEELNLARGDLGAEAFLAFAVRVLFEAEPALDVDLAALGEVFVGQLGLPAPCGDSKPGGVLFRFALSVLALFGGGDRHLAEGRSLRGVAQLRVASEIADDRDL